MVQLNETDSDSDSDQVPEGWPTNGSISFVDVSIKLGYLLPYALRNVSFDIEGGEKVGIIRKNGAGDSSVFSALFNLVDHFEGEIIIDDVFLTDRLSRRAGINLMPTDAVVYANRTIRENLDAHANYSDSEIRSILSKVNLVHRIEGIGGLDAKFHFDYVPLTAGERQLFFLAAFILSKHKILCYDEEEANIDEETAELIRSVIFSELKYCTVLIKPHIRATVKHYDRLLIIDNCQIVANGAPKEFLPLLKYQCNVQIN